MELFFVSLILFNGGESICKREEDSFFERVVLLEYKVGKDRSAASEYIRKEKDKCAMYRERSLRIFLADLEGNWRQGRSLEGHTLGQLHVLVEPVGRTKDNAQMWVDLGWRRRGGDLGGRVGLGTLECTGEAGIQGNGKDQIRKT